MTTYYRPQAQTGGQRPETALSLAGTAAWFTHVECLRRGAPSEWIAATDLPRDVQERISAPRAPIAGLSLAEPRIMGIVNVTPDSFSDGGRFAGPDAATRAALALHAEGADILDIGGESTRPGAQEVDVQDEIARIAPVVSGLRAAGSSAVISIDTRKAPVAEAALTAGADLVNDISGFQFDPSLKTLCGHRGVPVCTMHAQGLPQTMQDDPRYEDVLLDVYDALEAQVRRLEKAGLTRAKILVDPGIGFGKTEAHNLALLAGVSLFHGLGCPILIGVSRKGFIGRIGDAPDPLNRAPGSIALALDAVRQAVQVVRVHDVAETKQALALWRAATQGNLHE